MLGLFQVNQYYIHIQIKKSGHPDLDPNFTVFCGGFKSCQIRILRLQNKNIENIKEMMV